MIAHALIALILSSSCAMAATAPAPAGGAAAAIALGDDIAILRCAPGSRCVDLIWKGRTSAAFLSVPEGETILDIAGCAWTGDGLAIVISSTGAGGCAVRYTTARPANGTFSPFALARISGFTSAPACIAIANPIGDTLELVFGDARTVYTARNGCPNPPMDLQVRAQLVEAQRSETGTTPTP